MHGECSISSSWAHSDSDMTEFFDPLSNKRTDQYGGSFENRTRIAVEVSKSIRAIWDKPLFFRVSASDWLDEVLGPEKGENREWAWW